MENKALNLIKITLPPLIAPLLYFAYPNAPVLLAFAALALFLVFRKEALGWKGVGFRTDNLKESIRIYLLLCVFTLLGAFVVSKLNIDFGKEPIGPGLIWLVFVSAAVQEIYFRGYFVVNAKKALTSPWVITFYTSIVFALFHLVLMPFRLFDMSIVVFSFVVSLLWTSVYLKYSNLYLMIALHFVNNLGLYFIILG